MRPATDAAFERFRSSGDVGALADVFDATAPELLRVAVHLARDVHTAEDLVQATFLAAIEKRATWDARQRVLPWLLGILANHARRERHASRRSIDAERIARTPPASPPAAAEASEIGDTVRAAIATLPDVYCRVLDLHLHAGLPAHEIATALERPAGTVRTQIVRGMEMLRHALPRGLMVGIAVPIDVGRGLAAVRATVLASGHAASAGIAAAAPGSLLLGSGALAMKKIAVAVASIVLVSALALLVPWRGEASSVQRAEAPATAAAATTPTPATVQATSADASPTPVADRAPTAPAPTALLRVRVQDARYRAVAGAKVAASTPFDGAFQIPDPELGTHRTPRAAGVTDDQGICALPAELGVRYRVDVDASGHVASVNNVCAGPEVVVCVGDGGAVIGTVRRAESGQPVVGARVLGTPRGVLFANPAWSAETDGAGRYMVERIPSGAYLVTLVSPEEALATERVEVMEGGVVTLDFALAAPLATAGRVTDAETHAPIAGAEVKADSLGRKIVRTDADGRYRLIGFPIDVYDDLYVSAAGYACGFGYVERTGAEQACDFELVPGASLRGRVVDEVGRALCDARVLAMTPLVPRWTQRDAKGRNAVRLGQPEWTGVWTNAQGEFLIPGVDPRKSYQIFACKPCFGSAVADLPACLNAGRALDVGDLVLRTPGAIRGRITGSSKRALARLQVQIRSRSLPALRREGEPAREGVVLSPYVGAAAITPDGEGNFAALDLAPGEYAIKVIASDDLGVDTRAVVVSGETAVVDIHLTVAEVEGRVRWDRHGRVSVSVQTEEGRSYDNVRTGSDGSFFALAPPGRYFVFVNDGPVDPHRRVFDLHAGINTVEIEDAPEPAEITGEVIDGAGQRVGGARVTVLGGESRTLLVGSAIADSAGKFSVQVTAGAVVDISARPPLGDGKDPLLESAIAFRNPEVYGRARDVIAGTRGVTVVVGTRR